MSAAAAARRTFARLLRERTRRSSVPCGLVVMYHAIAHEGGDPARRLVPPLAREVFRGQLDHVRRWYDVVPLLALQDEVRTRGPGERVPVALTFDDDLRSHVRIAAPLLQERGLPATFFLTGAGLDGPFAWWWQDLDTIAARGSAELARLRRALAESWPWASVDAELRALARTIEGLPPGEQDAVAGRIRQLTGGPPPDLALDAAQVAGLAGSGFSIGFHTRDHRALTTLDDASLRRALRDGRDRLQAVVGAPLTVIAYPYCRADLRVADAAMHSGFELGVTCNQRPVGPHDHPLLIDRVDGWSPSLGHLALALAWAAARAR